VDPFVGFTVFPCFWVVGEETACMGESLSWVFAVMTPCQVCLCPSTKMPCFAAWG